MYLQRQEIRGIKFQEEQKSLKSLYDNKKIQQFITEVEKLKLKNGTVSQQSIQASNHFKQILIKNQRAMKIINSPKTEWKVNKIDDRSQLAVRVTGTNVQLRYQGTLTTNMQNLATMIYQINLFHNWVPFCTIGQDLKQVSPLQKICYLQFKIPFLTERYCYFYGLGIDRIDQNGTVIIYGEGISQNQEFLKRYAINVDRKKIDKMVLMDLKYFICQINYKSQNQFVFKCYTEIDSHMPIIPQWLLNAVIKQMGGFIFDRVIKQSNNFKGSIWQKEKIRDANNPFYYWLHKRVQYWCQINRKQKNNTKL